MSPMDSTGMDDYGEAVQRLATSIGALTFGRFTLTSGGTSNFYFDGRLLTLHPEGSRLVGRAMLQLVLERGAEAIAGPTLGADPIVTSVAVLSQMNGTPVSAAIVRPEAKGHGRGKLIEGPSVQGKKVAVVDDTCTTGRSLLHAVDAVEAEGGEVVGVLCILDRHEGGGEKIRERGYELTALLEGDESGGVSPAGQVGGPQ